MTKHEADVIGGLNMTDQISNEAYKQIMIAAQDENEPCDDCISRQAVLDMQYRIDDSATLSSRDVVNVDDIEDLPSVTPQPKMGHREYNDIYDHYLCGNCKTVVMDYDNYCPNCGAKFEGIRKDLPYCTCQNIGMALIKLELLEKQGCKVIEPQEGGVNE